MLPTHVPLPVPGEYLEGAALPMAETSRGSRWRVAAVATLVVAAIATVVVWPTGFPDALVAGAVLSAIGVTVSLVALLRSDRAHRVSPAVTAVLSLLPVLACAFAP
jgi:hypothetical protein